MKNVLACALAICLLATVACQRDEASASPKPAGTTTDLTKSAPAAQAAKPGDAKPAAKPAEAAQPAAQATATIQPAAPAAPTVKPHPPTPAEIAAVKGQKLQAVVHTPRGDIHLRLFPDTAPTSVANFVQLAEIKFFDGLAFHRVEPGFVIQGGDPLSRDAANPRVGTGGPGYMIPAEVGVGNPQKHEPGTLAMADAGLNTAGSQFYVTLNATPNLDGRYTVFGRVLAPADLEVARKVQRGDKFSVEIVRGK